MKFGQNKTLPQRQLMVVVSCKDKQIPSVWSASARGLLTLQHSVPASRLVSPWTVLRPCCPHTLLPRSRERAAPRGSLKTQRVKKKTSRLERRSLEKRNKGGLGQMLAGVWVPFIKAALWIFKVCFFLIQQVADTSSPTPSLTLFLNRNHHSCFKLRHRIKSSKDSVYACVPNYKGNWSLLHI